MLKTPHVLMIGKQAQPVSPSSMTGPLASGVPGVLAAYDLALKKHGRLTLADHLRATAEIAERGFVIDEVFVATVA